MDCIGDRERPHCHNQVEQVWTPDGWVSENGAQWPFCKECDEVFELREGR